MLTRIISRVSSTRNACRRACCTTVSDSGDRGGETRQKDADYYIDARKKYSAISNPLKKNVTGKSIEDRICYNSVINSYADKSSFLDKVSRHHRVESLRLKKERDDKLDTPADSVVALMLKNENENLAEEPTKETRPGENEEGRVQFPFARFTDVNTQFETLKERRRQLRRPPIVDDDEMVFGTADPDFPISRIPCGGCGSLLHCQNPSVPGFLPKEIITSKSSEHMLRGEICQRCSFLREHNVALNMQISPDQYPSIISVIKDQKALAVLIIDLTDFPCSLWPGIVDIIGHKRPVVVVGNKVDLIPKDRPGHIERIKSSLKTWISQSGLNAANVKHICLVSAVTGYGIESLVTKIQTSWGYQGDVYLLGCTNVGKSSLFNALIQSDLCKARAADLLCRATVSAWPGTTLNLLKFPMLRPTSIRLSQRVQRLKVQVEQDLVEEVLRKQKLQDTRQAKYATLIGHVGRTFTSVKDDDEVGDPFSIKSSTVPGELTSFFNPNHAEFRDGKWCLDTPGTISHDQILTLLTLQELMMVLPNRLLRPRTLLLRPGSTYFLAGLARIDYPQGPHPLLLTTMASHRLPLTVVDYSDADDAYTQLLGTLLLGVPFGGQQRLAQWPGLTGKHLTIEGTGWHSSAADIVLSSAGWVAVTGDKKVRYDLTVHTPQGRGIHIRDPPILPHAVGLRGSRIPNSISFSNRPFWSS